MKITVDQLIRIGACNAQVDLFRFHYPNGFEVTREGLVIATGQGFNLEWCASTGLLSKKQRAHYNKAIAPAGKAYREAVASARKAYREAVASARKAYSEAVAVAIASALGV